MDATDLLRNLVANVAFLLLMLPLFGAVLVAASAGLGREAVRKTALTNVLLTWALSIVMVIAYDPERRTEEGDRVTIQMDTVLPWLQIGAAGRNSTPSAAPPVGRSSTPSDPPPAGRNATPSNAGSLAVTIAVGVDGLNLWPIAATCWLAAAAVFAAAEVDHRRPAPLYAALLVTQSTLIGAFAALDGMLFVFCLEASVLPLWMLLGRWGRSARQSVARRAFLFQTAGGLLVFVGLIGLTVTVAAARGADTISAGISPSDNQAAEPIFLVPPLLFQAPPVAVWIAAAFVLGFWAKLGLFPLHTWFPAAFVAAPTSLRILLTGAFLPLGAYGLARFVLPLVITGDPDGPVPIAGEIQTVAIAAAVYFALVALAQTEPIRLLGYAGLCHFALAAVGLTSGNLTGATGGMLHVLSVALSLAALAVLTGALERPSEVAATSPPAAPCGTHIPPPLTRTRALAFLTFATLALVGLPGLSGFAGLLLVLWGIAAGPVDGGPGWLAAGACLMAWLVCAWALVSMLTRARSASRLPIHLSRTELACLLPLALVIVWIGLWPQFFTSRIEPSLRPWLAPPRVATGGPPVAPQPQSPRLAIAPYAADRNAAHPRAAGGPPAATARPHANAATPAWKGLHP